MICPFLLEKGLGDNMEYIKIKEQDAKHYIYEFEGKYPVIDPKAYAFSTAALLGDVELKEYASVENHITARYSRYTMPRMFSTFPRGFC